MATLVVINGLDQADSALETSIFIDLCVVLDPIRGGLSSMDDIASTMDGWAISSCHLTRLIAGGPTNLQELPWIYGLIPWMGS